MEKLIDYLVIGIYALCVAVVVLLFSPVWVPVMLITRLMEAFSNRLANAWERTK